MQLEGISQRNFKPTDYLQINSYEQLFGEKSFQVVYNETSSAVNQSVDAGISWAEEIVVEQTEKVF